MHPIYITAALTFAIAFFAFGAMLRQFTPPNHRRYIFWVWVGGFLMSPAAYYLVRVPMMIRPLTSWLESQTELGGVNLALADIVRLTFAPLTEEPAKLLPWLVAIVIGWPLIPARKLVAPISCSLGLGFAMGEMWLVAYFVAEANDPKLSSLPWYQFGGYINERLQTCITHSLFVLPAVWLSRRGWRTGLLGLVIGMALHFSGNAPIMLMRRDVWSLGPTTWGVIVQLWVLGFSIAGAIALAGVHLGSSLMRRVFRGRMICPECGAEYRQSILLGLNAGKWRYEPCGVCRKWHWVSLENLAPLPANQNKTVPRKSDE